MILKSIFLLFVSAAIFRSFVKLASGNRFQFSPKIKSETRSQVRNEDITSSNLAFDQVASEKPLRSGPSKIAEEEIILSAKFKFRNGEKIAKKETVPVTAKFNLEKSNSKAKTGKERDEIKSSTTRVQKMLGSPDKLTPKTVKTGKSIDSTARVPISKSQNVLKKTRRTQETIGKSDVRISSKLRETKQVSKDRGLQSGSFHLSSASTKILERMGSKHHARVTVKNKKNVMKQAFRMISQKGESTTRNSKEVLKKTLAVSVKSEKRARGNKKLLNKKMNRAIRTLNIHASMPTQQATKLSPSTVRADAAGGGFRKNEKLQYEYTNKFPASCPCAIAKGMNNGICWRFLDSTKTSCKKYNCIKSYVCVVGEKTKLTCMRKENTRRIVSTGDGNCRSENFKSFQYIPYSR